MEILAVFSAIVLALSIVLSILAIVFIVQSKYIRTCGKMILIAVLIVQIMIGINFVFGG